MRTPITSPSTARRLGGLAALALMGSLLVACGDDEGPAVASDNSSDSSGPAASADWKPQIITEGDDVTGLDFTGVAEPSGELMVELVTTGDGPEVQSGQTITADYFGQVPDADGPFDESFSSQPFQAMVGVGQLIAGWDQGLVGVPVGSRVLMEIPSDLGYGDTGTPDGSIPGGATLYFVVDIIDAQ